jgi:hypothetical protein
MAYQLALVTQLISTFRATDLNANIYILYITNIARALQKYKHWLRTLRLRYAYDLLLSERRKKGIYTI